jgi:5-formyltetrahydrofolate cyclo-ligase
VNDQQSLDQQSLDQQSLDQQSLDKQSLDKQSLDKQSLRERIWQRIDSDPAVRTAVPPHGRIPGFQGAEEAAARLAQLDEWRGSRVLKLNPDTPQLPVRRRAIEQGKLCYMAVPKLASALPFIALEQRSLSVSAELAASIEGSQRHGVPTRIEDLQPVDLIVCGTVAVHPSGVRIGKGAGYADLEFALLAELGLVTEHTQIATTVHDVQVLEQPLPETTHDFRVDLIVTPTRVIRCPRAARPSGLIWEHLDADKIAAIPALAARWRTDDPR